MSVKKFVGFPDFRRVLAMIYRKDKHHCGMFDSETFPKVLQDFFKTTVRYDEKNFVILLDGFSMPTPKQEKEFIEYALGVGPMEHFCEQNLTMALCGDCGDFGVTDSETFDELAVEFFGPGSYYAYSNIANDNYGGLCPAIDYEEETGAKEFEFDRFVLSRLSIEFDSISQRWLTFVTKEEE